MPSTPTLPPLGAAKLTGLLIKALQIRTMASTEPTQLAIAIQGDAIVALSTAPIGLDAFITLDTRVVDDPALTILAAFSNAHNSLLEVTRNATFVPVDSAHNLGEFVALIRDRAAQTTGGRWIQTSNAWREQQLLEPRRPTATDRDEATRDHPALARQEPHGDRACGLHEAGIMGRHTRSPSGRLGQSLGGSSDIRV